LASAIIVNVEDQFHNIITTNNSKVTLTIAGGPNGGKLGGTTAITVSKGVATFSKATLSMAGTYTLAAIDSSLAITTPVQFMQTITQGVTTVAAPHPSASYAFGQTITLSTTFKSTAPTSVPFTGTASILGQNSQVLGTATLSANGAVKFTLSGIVPGTYTCTISYPGDANHTAITSSSFTLLVKPAVTKTTLQASATQLPLGQSLTLTATVTSSSKSLTLPTGTVTFKDGITILGIVDLTGDIAELPITPSTTGTHDYTATYSGDLNFLLSVSTTKNVKIS